VPRVRENQCQGKNQKRISWKVERDLTEGDVLQQTGAATAPKGAGGLVPRHGVLVHEIVNELNTVSQGHLRMLGHGQDGSDGSPDF